MAVLDVISDLLVGVSIDAHLQALGETVGNVVVHIQLITREIIGIVVLLIDEVDDLRAHLEVLHGEGSDSIPRAKRPIVPSWIEDARSVIAADRNEDVE